jgi:quinoprotein glucose dehydrogenase
MAATIKTFLNPRSSALIRGSILLLSPVLLEGQARSDWPVYGGDLASTKYSALADINRSNVSQLTVAWEWKTGETPKTNPPARPGNFQNTPLMIGDTLYVSTPFNRVVALDANTGRVFWDYDPKAYEAGQVPNGTGFVHRGVATWTDGRQRRIFVNSRWRLIALDAATGQPVRAFGDTGVVDLTARLSRNGKTVNKLHYTQTSPPVVWRDLVILGNGVADTLVYPNDPPGDVQAFDVRSGRRVWSFSPIPDMPRAEGADTWRGDSWRIAGHTNVWAPFSVDEARGLVYLPVSTPSNDFYGARRPGQNLYGESLVCLDAATGKKKWHFQIVHHGLWDYDPASAPSVVSMNVGGRRIDAVVQLTKQGFAFVFDRVTGKPVWPIEERAVPQSDVAGEKSWATQPFPTRPPAFAPQGMTLDDVFDLTPELKAAAQAELKKYRLGPLYTPPSVQGTFMQPGIIGGANWGGSAFDPDTNILYVKTSHQPAVARIQPFDRTAPNARPTEVDADYVGNSGGGTNFTPPVAEGAAGGGRGGGGGGALPLAKPPYGELVAIALNTGDIAWRVPFGDTPTLRSHPALRGLTLPDRLGVAGAPGVIATKGGLILGGGGDNALYAFDKKTGKEIWRTELQRRSTSTPMTYRARSGRQFVVMATGSGSNASLVAWGVR